MSVLPLLSRLEELDINIRLAEGQLKIDAPRGKLTPVLIKELEDRKQELIGFFQEHVETQESYASIELVEKREYYPLYSAQKRLYIVHQLDKQGTGYNIPLALQLEGRVDKTRLENTFIRLVQRHESLRTSFEVVEEEPVQRIHENAAFSMKNGAWSEGREQVPRDFVKPFDLSRAPLLRVGLIKIAEEKHILILDMHHIITDGLSMGIFVKEFITLYSRDELPVLRIHYKDFTLWQNREDVKTAVKNQEDYWLNEFSAEIPVLELPVDFARPKVQGFEGSRLSVKLGEEESRQLKAFVSTGDVTLFMVLLSIYYVLLSKLSGQEDIVVGTPVGGRRHADLSPIIGMFVNTLPLRNYPLGKKTFNTFLQEIKTRTLEAFENQDYPFEELVEKAAVKRDTSRNPLFDVMFAMQNIGIEEVEIPGLKLQPYQYENNTSKFDLMLQAAAGEDNLLFTFEYSTNLFKDAAIQRFVTYFKKVISDILENPLVKLSEIEIISEAERHRVLFEFNDTASDYPRDQSVHGLFEEEVEKKPGKAAVVYEDQCFTYNQLNQEADKMAAYLQARGVTTGMPVGIMSEASLEMIVGLMAILKAGGAYLPIDPAYPPDRIDFMLKDSGAKILLTNLPEGDHFNCQLSIVNYQLSMSSQKFPFHHSSFIIHHSSNLAYIIYTSGSTGRPKGVMVTHQNIIRLVKNTNYITFNDDDRILQTGALEFDASTFEIWGALLNGMTLLLADKDKLLVPENLKGTISRNRITTMWLTSPLFNRMVQSDIEIFEGLETLLVGGDVLSPVHIDQVKRRFPRLKIINGYGPTENTTFSTTFLIEKEYRETIPIGKPIANSSTFIRDSHGHLQPIGIVGELWVGGDGVSRGYMNNPALTAEVFYRSYRTYKSYKTYSLYKTGDLARWLADGAVEFLGRIDQQVKIRGFRIEPGEIEIHLLSHPNIKEAVVLARKNDNEDKYLCAYVVPRSEDKPDVSDLKDFLSGDLPGYMIPSYFIPVEKIPLTPNGKVDWKALPKPEAAKPGEEYTAPRDAMEEKLAEIWAEVLGIEKAAIGIDSDFFELGGHSLKAAALVARIHNAFNVTIHLADVFKTPTIRKISTLFRGIHRVKGQKGSNIEKEREVMTL
jgi:amino acid adenylation domain-containing protein